MKIYVVEDDSFKYSKIKSLITSVLNDFDLISFDNVHDAVIQFKKALPEKIILDMSLPSHSAKAGEGSPIPMPTGGIEVILELRSMKVLDTPIIILTQYHEIEIDGEYYSISESENVFKDLFGMTQVQVALYENDSDEWKKKTTCFLEM